MTTNARTIYRGRLISVEVPKASADAVNDRIADIVGFHVSSLSPSVPLEQQLRALAFDCYSQGLFDGAQIESKVER